MSCPVICQTCLACFITFDKSKALSGVKTEGLYMNQSPSALDASVMHFLARLRGVFLLKNLPIDSIIGSVFRSAVPEVLHSRFAYTPLFLVETCSSWTNCELPQVQ